MSAILARTIDIWWPENNALVTITNARTEGYNCPAKTLKGSACGFYNRENSARRIHIHSAPALSGPPRASDFLLIARTESKSPHSSVESLALR